MGKWIEADDFIEADVIRWSEGVFERRRGAKKASRVGERRVVAEVLKDDGDWVRLLVRACEIVGEEHPGISFARLKPEAEIRRAKRTIRRGTPERLLWDDEGARAAVIGVQSRFMTLAR